jgi:ABC-type branched-subunit amino acid transport system substrate-binding protein
MRRAALGVIVAIGVGCSGSGGSKITIGAIMSQTGTLATIGQQELQAAQLAVNEINNAGGVLGSKLELVNVDDRSDPLGASAAATTLVTSDHVPAIVGAIASGSTIPAAMVTAPANVVLISGASTSPAISGMSPYVFRTCPSDALQGQLIAKRARAANLTRVAVTYVPGPYGEGLSNSFATNFTNLGGTVTFQQMYAEGQSSYSSLLTSIYATNPEAVLLVAYPIDGAQIIKDYNSAFSSQQTTWFFTDATEDPSFVQAIGPNNFTFNHEGTGSAAPSGSAYSAYAAAFAAAYGAPPLPGTFSANVYDATYLVALSIEKAAKADGAAIAASMRSVSNPPGTTVGPGQWATALSALTVGGEVNYEGASGSVDVNDSGDVIAPYDIWKVQGGTITVTEMSVSP